jgi:hypothetical protein
MRRAICQTAANTLFRASFSTALPLHASICSARLAAEDSVGIAGGSLGSTGRLDA